MERMGKNGKSKNVILLSMIRCLLAAWLISGVALMLLALLWYRFMFGEAVVTIGILGIYALTCLAAGILMGKCAQSRRFFWGMLTGTLYFWVLVIMTAAVNRGFKDLGTHFFTTWMICAGSGMLGGMVS